MMPKLPWFKFFPSDWKTDPSLSMCSASTRGIWIDLLCAMDQQGRRGELTASLEQLSRIGRCTIDEMNIALNELENTGTANVKSNGVVVKVINRRMRKEEKSRINNAKRQEKFRENGGGDPDRWTYIRARILIMDEKKCAYCGKKATTVDHIIPRSRGGDEDDNNLVACCRVCNTFKNNRTPIEAKMDFHTLFKRLKISDLFGSNAQCNKEVTGRSQKSEVRSQKIEIQKKENGASAPTRSFKKLNEKEFYNEVAGFKNDYPKEMLRSFYDYWKEPSATGIMRFQLEKTWDTSLRLKTWARRDKSFPKVESRQTGAPTESPKLKIPTT